MRQSWESMASNKEPNAISLSGKLYILELPKIWFLNIGKYILWENSNHTDISYIQIKLYFIIIIM